MIIKTLKVSIVTEDIKNNENKAITKMKKQEIKINIDVLKQLQKRVKTDLKN